MHFTVMDNTPLFPYGRGLSRMQNLHLEGTYALLGTDFPVCALISGLLGFTGIAVAAVGIAKLLFVVFLVLFLISLIAHFGRRGTVR
jgi:uncharacterized membrane protein YtjA (UPF0391 family)